MRQRAGQHVASGKVARAAANGFPIPLPTTPAVSGPVISVLARPVQRPVRAAGAHSNAPLTAARSRPVRSRPTSPRQGRNCSMHGGSGSLGSQGPEVHDARSSALHSLAKRIQTMFPQVCNLSVPTKPRHAGRSRRAGPPNLVPPPKSPPPPPPPPPPPASLPPCSPAASACTPVRPCAPLLARCRS